jgi:hypothetical protein
MRWRLVAAAVIARVKAPPPKGALHGLWAAPIAWLMASSVVAAQENPNPAGSSSTTTLPEIRVIATTPVAPPRVTPRAAAAPAAVRPAPAPEAAPKPVPGAVEQDKIPSTFRPSGLRRSTTRGRRTYCNRCFPGHRHTAGARRLPERGAHQRSFRRRRQLGLDPAECHQPADARSQQSGLRSRRHRRCTRLRDEEWIHLSCH